MLAGFLISDSLPDGRTVRHGMFLGNILFIFKA
jgi:hypothetical protein